MSLEYIIRSRQRKLERKWRLQEEQEAREEEERLARLEEEAKRREEAAYRKRILLEQQESERLRQARMIKEQEAAARKWENQCDTLVSQIKERIQKDKKLEEIRLIVHRHEPSLQELDWNNWLLSDPLNQRLAELDFEMAMELFKRDNLLAKRRHGARGKKSAIGALAFGGSEGSRSYLTTGFNPDDFDLNLGFTVSYWVRPDEVGDLMFAFGRRHNSNQRFAYGINTAKAIYAGVGNQRVRSNWTAMGATTNPQLAGLFNDENELKTGRFIHFAATYADRASTSEGQVDHKIYLNGVHIKTTAINWSATGGGTSGMFIGARNNVGDYNQGWKCALSHLAIFDKEQSSTYIEDIYNAGRTGTDFTGQSGLVGYWKFDKGSGTTVTDHSGNGNDGTFATDGTGLPTWV